MIPYEKTYMDVLDSRDGWRMINTMVVRGAPAIAIAGVLSLSVELANADLPDTAADTLELINDRLTYLVTSRPTAVNLAIACNDLKRVVAAKVGEPGVTPRDLAEAVIATSEELMRTDTEGNLRMGAHTLRDVDRQLACSTPCARTRRRRGQDQVAGHISAICGPPI